MGADVGEMAAMSTSKCLATDFLHNLSYIASVKKPVIAVVRGYAVRLPDWLSLVRRRRRACHDGRHYLRRRRGKLCTAGDQARDHSGYVYSPCTKGAGGTQRLIRAVGKYRAMEIVLSGEPISARQAEAIG